MSWFPVLFILFFSIVLHEVSHGFVAWLQGDPTARDAGRLTLNPLKHVDPLGTVILPAALVLLKSPFLFGWAKPVPFDPRYFKRRRSGTFAVAVAGPLTNLALALVFAAAFRAYGPSTALSPFLVYGVAINLLLALFNLLPIPPLDGSKAVAMFLPPPVIRAYLSIGRWGIVILLALSYTGITPRILLPAFLRLVSLFTGLPPSALD